MDSSDGAGEGTADTINRDVVDAEEGVLRSVPSERLSGGVGSEASSTGDAQNCEY